jgi:peptidoglycan/LPS O-acetylase OafA/YrhL
MGRSDPAPLSSVAYQKRKYVPELDGLRALSVLLVISVHMHDSFGKWVSGQLGVVIFFVLSGYLITTLSLREEAERGRLSLGAFYIRRCFRIFPLYYFTLALYCLLIFGLRVNYSEKGPLLTEALPGLLLYFQEVPFFWGLDVGGRVVREGIPFNHSWSLGIEEKFYLVWPLLAFVLWRGRSGWRFGGTLALVVLLGVAPFPLGLAGLAPLGLCLLQYHFILVGCLLALVLEDGRLFERLRFLGAGAWVYASLAVLVALQLAMPHLAVGHLTWARPLYGLAVVAFLACVVTGDGPVQRFLRWGPLVFIGRLSYGIYLIHVLCVNAAEKVFPPHTGSVAWTFAAFLLACGLSVAVAYVLYLLIEKPLIEIGRRWSRRVQEAPRRVPEPGRVAVPVG